MTTAIARKEIVDWMMEEAGGLCQVFGEVSLDNNGLTIVPFPGSELGETATITVATFSKRLNEWADTNRAAENSYHRRAAQAILQSKWDDLDYDATITWAVVEDTLFS